MIFLFVLACFPYLGEESKSYQSVKKNKNRSRVIKYSIDIPNVIFMGSDKKLTLKSNIFNQLNSSDVAFYIKGDEDTENSLIESASDLRMGKNTLLAKINSKIVVEKDIYVLDELSYNLESPDSLDGGYFKDGLLSAYSSDNISVSINLPDNLPEGLPLIFIIDGKRYEANEITEAINQRLEKSDKFYSFVVNAHLLVDGKKSDILHSQEFRLFPNILNRVLPIEGEVGDRAALGDISEVPYIEVDGGSVRGPLANETTNEKNFSLWAKGSFEGNDIVVRNRVGSYLIFFIKDNKIQAYPLGNIVKDEKDVKADVYIKYNGKEYFWFSHKITLKDNESKLTPLIGFWNGVYNGCNKCYANASILSILRNWYDNKKSENLLDQMLRAFLIFLNEINRGISKPLLNNHIVAAILHYMNHLAANGDRDIFLGYNGRQQDADQFSSGIISHINRLKEAYGGEVLENNIFNTDYNELRDKITKIIVPLPDSNNSLKELVNRAEIKNLSSYEDPSSYIYGQGRRYLNKNEAPIYGNAFKINDEWVIKTKKGDIKSIPQEDRGEFKAGNENKLLWISLTNYKNGEIVDDSHVLSENLSGKSLYLRSVSFRSSDIPKVIASNEEEAKSLERAVYGKDVYSNGEAATGIESDYVAAENGRQVLDLERDEMKHLREALSLKALSTSSIYTSVNGQTYSIETYGDHIYLNEAEVPLDSIVIDLKASASEVDIAYVGGKQGILENVKVVRSIDHSIGDRLAILIARDPNKKAKIDIEDTIKIGEEEFVLNAVIVKTGKISSGHYYTYLRDGNDGLGESLFRQFNDSSVSSLFVKLNDIEKENILQLFYEKKQPML